MKIISNGLAVGLAILAVFLMVGCSSYQEIGYLVDHETGQKPHFHVLVDNQSGRVFGQMLQAPGEYHCSGMRTALEVAELRQQYPGAEISQYKDCVRYKEAQILAGPSGASQAGTPIAGMAVGGGLAALGAYGGDSITNNNRTSSQGGSGGMGGAGGAGGAGGKGGIGMGGKGGNAKAFSK